MANDGDILDKADALLKRHASSAAGSDTAGIPVLTELIEPPSLTASAEEVGELARDIFTKVLAEVEGRLAADLEKRLIQHLESEVHSAVASALGDLRQELANAIGDAVAEALHQRQVK